MARASVSVIDALGRKASAFLIDLIRPADPVLAPYVRTAPKARRILASLIGLVLLAFVGAAYGYFFAVLPPAFRLPLALPLAILMLLAIWALPDEGKAPVGIMVRLLFAFVAVAMVWPNYLAIALPGLPWISFRRLTVFPMSIALLIGISISSRFREDLRRYMNGFPIMSKFVLAFVGAQFASLAFSPDRADAVTNFLNFQAMWTAVFFVGLVAFQDRRRAFKLLMLVVVCAVIVAAIGIAESFKQEVLWANSIPSFLKIADSDLSLYITPGFRNGYYRVKSTLGNPLPYAELMAFSSMAVTLFIFRTRSFSVRVGLVGLNAVIVYGMVQSQSRLGLIGVLFGHALFTIFWAARHWRGNKLSVLGPALTIAFPAAAGVLGMAIMSVSSLHDAVLGGHETAASNLARETQWKMMPDAFIRSPIFGFGPRQGAGELGFGSKFVTIDSYYISVLLDYGIVGFLIYYSIIFMAIWKAGNIAIWEDGDDGDLAMVSAIVLSVFLLVKSVSSQEDNHWLIFLFLALVVVLSRGKPEYGLFAPRRSPSGNVMIGRQAAD